MVESLRNFIQHNIELIDKELWVELYNKARIEIPFQMGNLTTSLIKSDVNPLEKLDKILPEMFSDSTVKELHIPDNVTAITRQAFKSCYFLERVSLPETLTKIDGSAFSYCYNLDCIEFRGTLTNLPNLPPSLLQDCSTNIIHCIDGDYDVEQRSQVPHDSEIGDRIDYD